MQWKYLTSDIPHTTTELTNILLSNRGISDVEAFFHPPHPETITLADMGFSETAVKTTVETIKGAAAQKRDIVIFGDYDADGICATAILWEALDSIGCVARPFIPQRDTHGYGLTIAALDAICAEKKPDMIITVDNGIVAHAAAAYAHTLGITLVITDHHQPEKTTAGEAYYPQSAAVMHTTRLCGATVAWVLARELNASTVAKSLDLCGLATISDQVPLTAANRSFAYHGIKALQKTKRIGLRALFQEGKILPESLDSYSIGFVLSPRINAMGRLAHGMDALRLLCTRNLGRAAQLASILSSMNVERQDMTQAQFEEAVAQVKLQQEESIIIVHSSEFHEGVIGLIAGRLVEKFSKPAVVLSSSAARIKGSARSVPGVHITELLRSVREHLLEVGGHPMAGGCSLTIESLDAFRAALYKKAKETITTELLLPIKELECILPAELITTELCSVLETFAPFGSANAQPVFGCSDMTVVGQERLGREQKHLKLMLKPSDGSREPIEALYWNAGYRNNEFAVGTIVNCAARVQCNSWKGKTKLQLVIADLQPTL